jgi:ferredoxin
MARVLITDLELSFDVKEEEIIYNALSDQDFELPHGCLSGSCGACRINIEAGMENLKPASLIEQNTIDSLKSEFPSYKNIRLACRARVIGDVKFSIIK